MCASSFVFYLSLSMKYSRLDCGMRITVLGSKQIGFSPLAIILSRLVKSLSYFSITFLFSGFDGGNASFGVGRGGGWSS